MSFNALGTDCQLSTRSASKRLYGTPILPQSFQAPPVLWKLTRDFPDRDAHQVGVAKYQRKSVIRELRNGELKENTHGLAAS